MRVLYADYMDEIAKQIGVRPKPLNHPSLLAKLLLGPLFPTRYRLDGPGKSDKAKEIFKHLHT